MTYRSIQLRFEDSRAESAALVGEAERQRRIAIRYLGRIRDLLIETTEAYARVRSTHAEIRARIDDWKKGFTHVEK